MSDRPSIGNMLQQASQRLIRGGLRMVLEDNREELLQFLRDAETNRAKALLEDICRRVPHAAGVITMLMGGTAEQAISNVRLFDDELADTMHENIGTLRKLQAAWNRGQDTP